MQRQGLRQGFRRGWTVAAVVAAAVGVGALDAGAAAATTVTFTTPGTHSFSVPSNVTGITVTAIGAAGGACDVASSTGGRGATVTAAVPVSPGESLSVGVGGVGGAGCDSTTGAAGGSGGGGAGGAATVFDAAGGGGASGVGPGALASGANPLVVAAGGGGAALCVNGGDAGSPGVDGSLGCDGPATGGGGGAGTQTAGGAGGVAGDSNAGAGSDGTPGAGGAGGFGDPTEPTSAGGGGGGGYFGGGGGGGSGFESDGGGGGGGSSFTAASATGVSGPTPTSASAGVTITYTALPAPTAITGSASLVNTTSATISGTVNPEGLATTYTFQYGTTTGYGTSTPSAGAGSGSTASTVSAALSGLKPDTTYHFRIVATNVSGPTDGADATFTTKSPPVSIKVHPSTVFAGRRVKVFGSAGDCSVGDTVTLLSAAFSHAHDFAGVPAISAKVKSGGGYSTTTRIPATRAARTYTITGRCGGGNLGVHARLRVRHHHVAPKFTG